MSEVESKLKALREIMAREGLNAIRFRGVDWFSWATGGGSNVVIFTNETGVAEVLITENRAFVLTNEIEAARLVEEEVGEEFEVCSSRWSDAIGLDRMAYELCGKGLIVSDRPSPRELALPHSIHQMKLRLSLEEVDRYRNLGRDAAEAMTDALARAEPHWSESRLAGEGARELWSRGIHPTLVLVAGSERLEKHRHPFPTHQPLGHRAMMVFCARRHGLYANLTRFVGFREPSQNESERMRIVAQFEAAAFRASQPGATLNEIFESIKEAYVSAGFEHEIDKQHFGGLTGYLSREAFARPLLESEIPVFVQDHSALAWNPTLPGSKIEDTVLVTKSGVEILTIDPRWPTLEVNGLKRPDIMIKKS